MEILKKCPLCESEGIAFLHNSTDYLVSHEIFSVFICNECDFVFINPRPLPDQLPAYYNSVDYISHSESQKSITERIYGLIKKHMLKRKLGIVKKYITKEGGEAILDYGCGTGDFVRYCSDYGFISLGYEPNSSAAETARNKGLKVLGTNNDLLNIKKGSVDAVTLWHVLEHIHDFKYVLDYLTAILKDNGLLIIAVPEHKSFDSKYYNNEWAAWDVPRHLYHFKEETLLMAVSSLNYNLIRKYPLMFDSFYVSILSENNIKALGGVVRAFLVGLLSNLLAFFRIYPYSSQIYIFKKSFKDE